MSNCEICGEPMPPGEEMFKYHGLSGPCPKPPLPKAAPDTITIPRSQYEALVSAKDALAMLFAVGPIDGWREHVAGKLAALRAAGHRDG